MQGTRVQRPLGAKSVLQTTGDYQMTGLLWLLAALIYTLLLIAIVRVVRFGRGE